MSILLPDLPYAVDALEPHMSAETLRLHHGKHHKSYVDKTNRLIENTELADADLATIARRAARDEGLTTLFDNAAQAWNHCFFWNCMSPDTGAPAGDLVKLLERGFGGIDGFKRDFAAVATGRFGSGWAWLVLEHGRPRIVSTPNAETPLTRGQVPLLTCDVWEHAYYLDYRNKRALYVQAFLDHLVDWDFVAAQLTAADDAFAAFTLSRRSA